ncbi:MAG: alpha-glucosidase [Chloroflexi bacterium]|nr:alpha-glucosidase [Chloroflexota bacterium]
MQTLKWWQKAVFYQIYPRSFADSNGDGIGDLQGIIDRLDYLKDLGVDAVWLSPHYPSPLWDCGYDVADYTGVAPEYGSLDDFKRMLDGFHQRGMYLILDLVLNHTSDQHPWFLESSSSLSNPRRDWYIWSDGVGSNPPNNWYSAFGGSAWEFDPVTDQYYYHYFLKQQPDLNWRNPQVQEAMFNAVRFWLDMGVDGFRLDAIGTIFEDEGLRNQSAPVTQTELYRLVRSAKSPSERKWIDRVWREMYRHQHDLPEVHGLMQALRKVVDEYPDRMLVGETGMIEYYGNGEDELHMVFNFPLMDHTRFTPGGVKANQKERLKRLPPKAWPCNTLNNHDASRLGSHFGDGVHDEAIERIALALMLTLRGTPFLYNGEEIGMTNYLLEDIRQFRDTWGIGRYLTEIEEMKTPPDQALIYANQTGRDKVRTPMQWSNEANAGFSPEGVKTWLPVNPNYQKGINVRSQQKDPGSLWNYYRRLLRVRKENPALVAGDYQPLEHTPRNCLAYIRQSQGDGQTCLVAINYNAKSLSFDLNQCGKIKKTLFSTEEKHLHLKDEISITLAPYEVYLAEIEE